VDIQPQISVQKEDGILKVDDNRPHLICISKTCQKEDKTCCPKAELSMEKDNDDCHHGQIREKIGGDFPV
jgi:hypothetical protein